MKSIDRERPIVTGIAHFEAREVSRIANANTPHMGRGVEFGVGASRSPISHFPGCQTAIRPTVFSGVQRPRISVEELLRNIDQNKSKIDRVTAKSGSGTDLVVLRDVLKGVKAIVGDHAEVVVAASDPKFLRKSRDMDMPCDVLQQTLNWADPSKVIELVLKMLQNGGFADGAEVSFPIPTFPSNSKDWATDIAELLGDAGHDSHLAPLLIQRDVEEAIGLVGWSNFSASVREKTARIRGFYVDGGCFDYEVQAAQLVGIY